MRAGRFAVAGLVAMLALVGTGSTGRGAEDRVQFRDPLTDEPLEIDLPPDATEAVRRFHETGENPYQGDEAAIANGRELYNRWCASCHMPDGSGRLGPSLIDDTWQYERTDTPLGQFEIIYAGGTGAMQPFGQRMSQDEILKVIAYTDHLRQQQQ